MRLKSFFFLATLFAFASCMTSNKKAFEEFTDINISSAAKVIQDEYQDMGQDYGKILALQLDDITRKI